MTMTAQQYQDAVAAGKVTAAQQKQISAAVDQMMASDDIKAKIEAAVTEQENQLVAQNMASGDIKAKIESAVTEQENQLIAQNMASDDIKAKIELRRRRTGRQAGGGEFRIRRCAGEAGSRCDRAD